MTSNECRRWYSAVSQVASDVASVADNPPLFVRACCTTSFSLIMMLKDDEWG
jgi:hypothetical protein